MLLWKDQITQKQRQHHNETYFGPQKNNNEHSRNISSRKLFIERKRPPLANHPERVKALQRHRAPKASEPSNIVVEYEEVWGIICPLFNTLLLLLYKDLSPNFTSLYLESTPSVYCSLLFYHYHFIFIDLLFFFFLSLWYVMKQTTISAAEKAKQEMSMRQEIAQSSKLGGDSGLVPHDGSGCYQCARKMAQVIILSQIPALVMIYMF